MIKKGSENMGNAYNDYMREYMRKYRSTPKGKEVAKKANKKYWDKKTAELNS